MINIQNLQNNKIYQLLILQKTQYFLHFNSFMNEREEKKMPYARDRFYNKSVLLVNISKFVCNVFLPLRRLPSSAKSQLFFSFVLQSLDIFQCTIKKFNIYKAYHVHSQMN